MKEETLLKTRYNIGDPVNVCINDCIIEGNIRWYYFQI